MTDKKIEEYLERAEKILKNHKPDYKLHSNQDTIEIAKMIQLEEHREQIEITTDQEIDGIKFKKLLQDQVLDAKKDL